MLPLMRKKSSELSKELSTDFIQSKLKSLVISFDEDEKLENYEEDRKLIPMSRKSIEKIFAMNNQSLCELNNYLTLTMVRVETIVNEKIETVETYSIDYKLLIQIIKYFYIGKEGHPHPFAIFKNSIDKILEMLNIKKEKRIEYLTIYEVEEHEVGFHNDFKKAIGRFEGRTVDDDINIERDMDQGEISKQMRKMCFDDLEKQIQILEKESERRKYRKEDIAAFAPQTTNKDIEEKDEIKQEEKPILLKSKKPIKPKRKIEQPVEKELTKENIQKIQEEEERKIDETNYSNLSRKDNKHIDENEEAKLRSTTLETLTTKNSLNEPQIFSMDSLHQEDIIECKMASCISAPPKDVVTFPFTFFNFSPSLHSVFISGSCVELGYWNPSQAIQLDKDYDRDGYYKKEILIHKNSFPFEYKCFNKDTYGNITWLGKPMNNFIVRNEIYPLISEIDDNSLTISQFNIRYYNTIDGNNIWENRRDKMISAMLKSKSDIINVQELTSVQFEDLSKYISTLYDKIGFYRNDSKNSEQDAIFYNRAKYSYLCYGQFWLSTTPKVPSISFGNYFPRICTWVNLKEKNNGKQFLIFNTQLSHINKDKNILLTNVLLEEIEKIIKEKSNVDEVILTGCFYCDEESEVIKEIVNRGFIKVKFEGKTYHAFTGNAEVTYDHMFYLNTKKGFKVSKTKVLETESVVDQSRHIFISDHFPIIAQLTAI